MKAVDKLRLSVADSLASSKLAEAAGLDRNVLSAEMEPLLHRFDENDLGRMLVAIHSGVDVSGAVGNDRAEALTDAIIDKARRLVEKDRALDKLARAIVGE